MLSVAGLNSKLLFVPPKNDEFKVIVTSFGGGRTGDYKLRITGKEELLEPLQKNALALAKAAAAEDESGRTLVAGNISTADQVNTILMAGRADLVALARPHLSEPNFTLHAAAWYGVEQPELWPKQYHSAMNQANILSQREYEEWCELKRSSKPPSHQVTE